MTLVVLLFFVPILVGILLALNALFAPHHPDAEKITAYESGFMAITGQTRAPFSIAYYLVAILFLVFDLEIFLLFPFTVTTYTVGVYGFWIVTIFFLVLTFGFVIEIAKGVLNFTDQRSAITQPTVNNLSEHNQSNSPHTTKVKFLFKYVYFCALIVLFNLYFHNKGRARASVDSRLARNI